MKKASARMNITDSIKSGISRAELLNTPVRRASRLAGVLYWQKFVLTSGWANVYLMIIAHCHQCGAPCSHNNCKMMAALPAVYSVSSMRKNTKVVVVRFAAKKARYRQKNSDAVGQDVKMAIRS